MKLFVSINALVFRSVLYSLNVVLRKTTMLLIYTLIVLMIGYPIHAGIIHNDDHMDEKSFTNKTGKFFHKRCSLKGNMDNLDNAMKELDKIGDCFIKTLPSHTDEDDESLEEKCFENRKEVDKCLKRLIDFIEPCLPPEESYLPDFIMKSYEGFSKYLCEHIRVLTIEELMKNNMAKCINRFARHKEYNPQYLCFESAKFANHTYDSPITKQDLCEDIDFVYNCYERQFKEHCPDSPKAWEFESGLLNGLRSPCQEDEGNEEEEEKKK